MFRRRKWQQEQLRLLKAILKINKELKNLGASVKTGAPVFVEGWRIVACGRLTWEVRFRAGLTCEGFLREGSYDCPCFLLSISSILASSSGVEYFLMA